MRLRSIDNAVSIRMKRGIILGVLFLNLKCKQVI